MVRLDSDYSDYIEVFFIAHFQVPFSFKFLFFFKKPRRRFRNSPIFSSSKVLLSVNDHRMITMSSETTVCPGCNNTFTLRGYQSHLAQSNDPLCSAVFDQLKKAYEIDQDDISELSDDSDEDQVASEDAEMEEIWEPPREGAPYQEENDTQAGIDNEHNLEPLPVPPPTHETGSELDEDLNNAQHENHVRYIIGDGHGVKPAVWISYRDKYLSSHADEPLSQEESRDSGYGAALGGGDNPGHHSIPKKTGRLRNGPSFVESDRRHFQIF